MADVTEPAACGAVRRGEHMACFALLAAGIETGWLAEVRPEESDGLPDGIPRRIAQFWHSRALPPDVQASVEGLRALNPGFEHHLADDESARAFIQAHQGAEVAKLLDACFHVTMRADLWRLCDLHENGGVYIDVDTVATRPISAAAGAAGFGCLLTYAVGQPWCVNNGFLVAEPRSPVIAAILDALIGNLTRFARTGAFRNIWEETGPGVTTEASMRWLVRQSTEGTPPGRTGLLFRSYASVESVFHHAEHAYKATPEGNWRGAMPHPRPLPGG